MPEQLVVPPLAQPGPREVSPRSPEPKPGPRVVRQGLGFGGTIGATVLFCLSLTPSLLPRHWSLQAMVSALTMAIGYGLGELIGALVRRIWPQRSSTPAAVWWGFATTGAGTAAVVLQLSGGWQQELRQRLGMPPAQWQSLFIAIVAALGFALLLLSARAVRLAGLVLAGRFGRCTSRPVAALTAVVIVATGGAGLGYGVLFSGFVDVTGRVAAGANAIVAAELARPDSSYQSGGPGSLVSWESLGAQGRAFVAGAVPPPQLAVFTGGAASPPIRIYIGQVSTPDPVVRAELAVAELVRTGGFDRQVIAVVITTGTGWVNPVVPEALEYLHGGDTAVVAMQYSYLPSWMSFVVERSAAEAAAGALITAVQQRLAALPAQRRPVLVVYGESLGAYGTEAAFGSLPDLLAGVDGALLVGPPHNSPIWRQLTADREPGSPVWQPVHHGSDLVRFAQHGTDLPPAAAPPQVIYLQNPTDPIVWWSPQLLYREPAWLAEPRSPDVPARMRWLPVVTFWQVTADLLAATQVPYGHGHMYRQSIVDGWAALVPPADWTAADTSRLRATLG